MTAAEAVAQYRKSASALRRLRCWTGSAQRTKEAAVRHQQVMIEALKVLRDRNLEEVESLLNAERKLLNSAYGYSDDYDPNQAARERGAAKRHQYRVSQLIKER